MNCPLCACATLTVREEIPTVDLVLEYRRQLGVEIGKELADAGASIRLLECDRCGLGFFTPSVMGSSNFYADVSGTSGYYPPERWEFGRVARRIPKTAAVLDVGCGDADFLRMLSNEQKLGLEMNPKALARAAQKGIPVKNESLAEQPEGSADVVTLFHVMEHLSKPDTILDDLLRVLRPGGLLVLAVPNNDGFIGTAIHMPLNAPPHHVLRWNERSLRWIAEDRGLEIESIEFEPIWAEQLLFYRRAAYARYVARLFGCRPALYARGRATLLFRKIGTALAFAHGWLDQSVPTGVPGHSIVAYYRKRA